MTIGDTIYALRNGSNISREKFAEICGVSVQAVQKWEGGVSTPDLGNIAKIANYFGCSVDYLVFGQDIRKAEELKHTASLKPNYGNIPDGDSYYGMLAQEYRQSVEEGLDMSRYAELFTAAKKLPQGEIKKKIGDALFLAVSDAELRKEYPYNEPSDLSAIKRLRAGDFLRREKVNPNRLESKIYGAWTGRICGCMLGKTVEGIRTDELIPLLKQTGNYPMYRYIKRADLAEEMYGKYKYALKNRSYIDEVDGMPADDDTNYTVLAQLIVDQCGKDFTSNDVSAAWLRFLPKSAFYTAEQVAFCNFVKGYEPPESAKYKNPFREWIGAQIRGDYFGYIYPGNPEAAADAAFRDACISHVKNGIYGEMFVAAMLAWAAVTENLIQIIEGGLAQIPCTSRLHESICKILDMYRRGETREAAFAAIHKSYDEFTDHGWCHTIPNAMIVAAALLYGKGDYGKSICMAVETGFDTDCNGATVGSILGMLNGIDGIGDEWKKPIGDKLYTNIGDYNSVSIRACVQKTLQHIEL